jgi:hypothetical protein
MLYYEYQLNIAGAAGVLGRYVYTANGMFDPDITGVGHQPIGFDQMMLFYEQCVVTHSSIKVTFFSAAATEARVAIALTPDTTAPTIPGNVENGQMVMDRVIGVGGTGNHWASTQLDLSCDVGRYFGRTQRELVISPEFYSTSAANPTEQVYYQIQTWNPVGATTTSVALDVLLSYDVLFYEPRKVAPS